MLLLVKLLTFKTNKYDGNNIINYNYCILVCRFNADFDALVCESKVVSKRKITIDINDGEKILEVDGGGTLLSTLSNSGIFCRQLVEVEVLVFNVLAM